MVVVGEQRKNGGGGGIYTGGQMRRKEDAAQATRLRKLLRNFFCFLSVFVFFWESFGFGALAMGFGIFWG